MKVNLNADMGESFGRYTLGNDQALIPFVTTPQTQERCCGPCNSQSYREWNWGRMSPILTSWALGAEG